MRKGAKGDQQGDLEFKASVNNLACSLVSQRGFLGAQRRLSFFATSWEIFAHLAVFRWLYASSVGLTQTPFGIEGAVFNFMPLDLSDGSHFYVNDGNSC